MTRLEFMTVKQNTICLLSLPHTKKKMAIVWYHTPTAVVFKYADQTSVEVPHDKAPFVTNMEV